MKKPSLPYCPKCGKKVSVLLLDEYFKIWSCSSCKIRFSFYKPAKERVADPLKSTMRLLLDPEKKVSRYRHILDPSRKVNIEKMKADYKITADEKSLFELFDPAKLMKDFMLPSDMRITSPKRGLTRRGGISGNIKI